MYPFRETAGRFIPVLGRDARVEDQELSLLHSVSKKLLEELKHVQRGYSPNELGHVERELDTLIGLLEKGTSTAIHAHRAWHRLNGTTRTKEGALDRLLRRSSHEERAYLAHLRALRAHIGSWDRSTITDVKRSLEAIEAFTKHLHDELHGEILSMQLPGYQHAPFRPPHHGDR